jgi:hypothetical protein
VPIRGMLENSAFDQHAIGEMAAAFESVLATLNLVDRTDPVTELVATAIIECAKTGVIDRTRLRDCALDAVTKH